MKKFVFLLCVAVFMISMVSAEASEIGLTHTIATEMTELNEVFMEIEGSGVSYGALVNISIIDINNSSEEIVYITQTSGDENSSFEIEIDVEKILRHSGRYLCRAAAQNGTAGEFEFTYTRNEDVETIVAAVNEIAEKSELTKEEKISAIEKALTAEGNITIVSCISPMIKEISDSGKINKLASFLVDEEITIDNSRTVFTKTSAAIIVTDKNAEEIERLFNTYAEQLELETNVSGYGNASDAEKESMYARLSAINSSADNMKDFYDEVLEMLALARLDEAQGNSKVLSILKDYPDMFDLTTYNLADNDKEAMIRKVEKVFEEGKAVRSSDVQDILDEKIQKSTGGGTGSVGGGGGFGGGASVNSSYIDKETIDFDESVEYKGIIFNDLTGFEWAEESIYELSELGVLNGYSETVFGPQDNVTRAQLCKMICKLFGVQENKTEKIFRDVNEENWYYGFVNAMYKAGVVKGVDETSFAPEKFVTRQDAAVMIYRAIEKYSAITAEKQTEQFADGKEISEYARSYCNALREYEIINGKGENKFAPFDNMTRAEAAKMMSNVYHYIEEVR